MKWLGWASELTGCLCLAALAGAIGFLFGVEYGADQQLQRVAPRYEESLVKQKEHFQSEAIAREVAEYRINPKTGETRFCWKGEKWPEGESPNGP